jgi:UDP-N-acetylmuramoyl-tripeptide--D-alanyl-D-alanine ligase
MEPTDLAWAAKQMSARVLGPSEGSIAAVSTDTRGMAPGSLFFALTGENRDGHQFVPAAFRGGAAGAVVSRRLDARGPLLIVQDTLDALSALARAYRLKFELPVVGVTGSVGKTSTKEMIATVLSTTFRTLANEKNLNNEIGVPMTLFGLNSGHQAAVIEMGMRGSGQIDALARIAQPTIGVITRIGVAHIELLGSQRSIAAAKGELLVRLPRDGKAILPADDPFLPELLARVPEGVRVVRFGAGPDSDVQVEALGSLPDGRTEAVARAGGHETEFTLRAVGMHHLHNAAAAIAAGEALGIPLETCVQALETWEGAPGRMSIVAGVNGVIVLDDCYNAGPESMDAALRTLASLGGQNSVAVLGDMRELGDYAPEAHRRVGRIIVELGVARLVTIGELAREIAAEAVRHAVASGKPVPFVRCFADARVGAGPILRLVRPGEKVLVKGSRAMEMEVIVAALTGGSGRESTRHG